MDSRTEITGEKMDELRRLAEAARGMNADQSFVRVLYNEAASPDIILALLDRASSPARSAEGMVTPTKINVNDQFAVRLMNDGYEQLVKAATIWEDRSTGVKYAEACHPEQPDGTRIFQLHELMRFFGPLMFNGNNNLPFETTIEYLGDGLSAPVFLSSRVQELEKALRVLSDCVIMTERNRVIIGFESDKVAREAADAISALVERDSLTAKEA